MQTRLPLKPGEDLPVGKVRALDAELPTSMRGDEVVIEPPLPTPAPQKTDAPHGTPSEEGPPWEPPPERPEEAPSMPPAPRRVRPGCRSGVNNF